MLIHASRRKRDAQRIGSAGHADRMRASRESGNALFESFDLRSAHDLPRGKRVLPCARVFLA